MFRAIALSAAVLMASPVVAASGQAPASQSAAAAPQQAPAPTGKMVCRREEATGSIMSKRVCHTQEEWNTELAGKRGIMDDMRHQQMATQQAGMANTQ